MKYRAVPCGCGHRVCDDWHVSPCANVQGVNFTKVQAETVADLLNSQDALVRAVEDGLCQMKAR